MLLRRHREKKVVKPIAPETKPVKKAPKKSVSNKK